MACSPEKIQKYKELLINLFPTGPLWDFRNQPKLSALVGALAVEFCRVDDRITTLLEVESDPTKTIELLEDWERMLGLPDECSPEGADEIQRRLQVVQKYTNMGGISAAFYEFLTAQLGFPCVVTDYHVFQVGRSQVGDALYNDFEDALTVGETIGQQLLVWGWRTYFNVEIPTEGAETLEVGEEIGVPLRLFSNPLIECTIKKLKPAHTGVTFTFKE
jgi:uncharacterized protein YmfQ (DUF2313 family)